MKKKKHFYNDFWLYVLLLIIVYLAFVLLPSSSCEGSIACDVSSWSLSSNHIWVVFVAVGFFLFFSSIYMI
jgi:hypothetical protein